MTTDSISFGHEEPVWLMVRLNRWTDKVTSSLSSWRHARAGQVECLTIKSRVYETNELVVAVCVCSGRLLHLMWNVQRLIGLYSFASGRDECAALISFMHSENKREVERYRERERTLVLGSRRSLHETSSRKKIAINSRISSSRWGTP